MATYADFGRLCVKNGRLRRLYWVCGDQPALREEVVSSVRDQAGVADIDYVSLDTSETKEVDVWAALNQYPLDASKRRLVVVRGAERLKNLAKLRDWLDSKSMRGSTTPGTTAVFVSANDEWPQNHEVEIRQRVVKGWTSLYVRCSLPKEDRARRAGEIIRGWGDIGQGASEQLATRCAFDMGMAKAVMCKASYFKGEVSPKMIEYLCPRRVDESCAEALLGLEKGRAIRAAQELERHEMGRVLGVLAAELELLGRMNGIITRGLSLREIGTKLNVSETRIRRLVPYAKLYPRKNVVRRTLLLNKIDAAWQRGAVDGVMEALIASW